MRELAELLLDAPAGIKLYCPAWGEVVFQGISDDINVLTDKGEFDGYGRMDPNGECLLFPSKDRHDWEEWQEDLFRPNDVVSCDEGVFIYVGTVHYNVLSTYNMTAADGKQLLLPVAKCQFATPREAEIFFKTMKSNGLQWNSEQRKAEIIPTVQDETKEKMMGIEKVADKRAAKNDPMPCLETATEKENRQPPTTTGEPPRPVQKVLEKEQPPSEWTRFLEPTEEYTKNIRKRNGKIADCSVRMDLNIKYTLEHLKLQKVSTPLKSVINAALHAFLENNAEEIRKMVASSADHQMII